ncbi:hypothetical protein BAU08_07170 [Bordetella bronchialis]|uniref:Uncharacterized protein n=2 Tax=Bordetella bronchialis TaxID=463025 RepID=A0A193FFT8_9BORD|nr:hypothetical protein BAU06_06915 [Bordetella bronchialis]ANN71142.1 hypothetical protein BAU08_07170 [Bordetella bronchialis]
MPALFPQRQGIADLCKPEQYPRCVFEFGRNAYRARATRQDFLAEEQAVLPGCLLRQRIPRIQDIDGRHMPASGKPAEIVEKFAPDLRAADDREDVHDALAMGLDGREDGGGQHSTQDVRFAFRWTRRTGGMRGRDGKIRGSSY